MSFETKIETWHGNNLGTQLMWASLEELGIKKEDRLSDYPSSIVVNGKHEMYRWYRSVRASLDVGGKVKSGIRYLMISHELDRFRSKFGPNYYIILFVTFE